MRTDTLGGRRKPSPRRGGRNQMDFPPTLSLYSHSGAMSHSPQLSAHERIPVSIARVVRRTAHYGRPHCTPLTSPIITEIVQIPAHDHRQDAYGSWSCCWGNEVIVRLTYAVEGYGADFGGRFDTRTGRWHWSCYAD